MHKQAMLRAVEEAVSRKGSRGRVAVELGISRQAMAQWTSVPAKHVLAMERLSGISRYELRPDIYGPAPPSRSRHSARAAA